MSETQLSIDHITTDLTTFRTSIGDEDYILMVMVMS